AGIRPNEAGDHAQRRRLAGAIRTEQRVKLSLPHSEVETVDGGALEALDQAADYERELGQWNRHLVRHPKLRANGRRKTTLVERGFGLVNQRPRFCGRFPPSLVIASAAKQFSPPSQKPGLLRRSAPRNDEFTRSRYRRRA